MKLFFKRHQCEHCATNYDMTRSECPHCHEKNPDPDAKKFEHHIHLEFWRQIIFFLVGYIGLQVVVFFVSSIVSIVFASNSGLQGEELTKAYSQYLNTGNGLFSIYGWSYPILFVGLGLLLWKDWLQIRDSFKGLIPYAAGVVGFIAMIVANILINLALQGVYAAIGRPFPGTSGANESNIALMVKAVPVGAFFILGFIGPFCEELGYRVGLFSFASRFGKIPGYIIATLVFMAIHIGWDTIGTANFELELLSMPSYLIGGIGLAIIYDKFGFGASYIAHALNNIVAVIQYLV